jgi:AmiR/NasT family two-component response regulator
VPDALPHGFRDDGDVVSTSPLRVVVADNDPGALELVLTDLALEGHDVVGSCTDGTAALELCVRLRPDVAVLDHRMPPGPHGLEVAQRLADEAPEVRVIVFTNYQDPDLVQQVRASGASYLPKGNLRALRRAVAGLPAVG